MSEPLPFEIPKVCRPGVEANLRLLAEFAALVREVPLDDCRVPDVALWR